MVYRVKLLIGFLPRNSTALCFVSILLAVICVAANFTTIVKYKTTIQTVKTASGTQNEFHRKRTRRVEIAMFSIALVVCFSLVLQALLQALIMIYTGTSSFIRETCQDLRAFALDISICCPPWIMYYTTVHSHKTTITSNSISGVGIPTRSNVVVMK